MSAAGWFGFADRSDQALKKAVRAFEMPRPVVSLKIGSTCANPFEYDSKRLWSAPASSIR
jgi:hypothetical protein